MSQSLLDQIGLERATDLMNEATRKAIAQAHAAGLPVTVDLNGAIVRILPNGEVEAVEPPLNPAKDASRDA